MLAAACGGSGKESTPPAPELPSGLGTELAAATAEVGDSLAGGDTAAARAEAQELLDAIEAAIDAGDVPGALADDLRAAAERLLGLIPEEQPPPKEHEDKGKDKGKAKGHDKKDDGGDQGEEDESAGPPTDTTGTTDTTGITVTVP